MSTTGILQEGSHVGTAFISFHFHLFGPSFPFILAFWAFNSFCSFVFWALISFVFGFLGQNGFVSIYVYTRRVSLRYRYGYCIALGLARMWKKRNSSKLCTQMQGIAFGSSPYRFPWFGAPFKKKERLTRRLLHEEFSRFLTWLGLGRMNGIASAGWEPIWKEVRRYVHTAYILIYIYL